MRCETSSSGRFDREEGLAKKATVNDAFNLYFGSQKFRSLSASTRDIYMRNADKMIAFLGGDTLIDKIKRMRFIEWREENEHQTPTARLALLVTSNVYNHLIEVGYMDYNPTIDITISVKEKPIKRWSEAEVDKFLSMAPPHLRSAMLMALYTGQRKSDLARIRWVDFDGKTIFVKQRKTGKELHIPVHPKLLADIAPRQPKRYATGKVNPYILNNMNGDPWSPGSLGAAISRFARRIGIYGKSIHGIRKTTASILAENGCSPHQIRAITGHTSLREVERYTLEADQKKLANEAIMSWGAQ